MRTQRTARRSPHHLVGSAALAVLTASCWWAWMAWDRGHETDAVTAATSGPYQAWQVIGCIACLIVLGVVAAVRLPARLVVPIMPVAFTAAWSWTAASSDRSGLWLVGALLVFFGVLVGIVIVSGLTTAARRTPARVGSTTA